MAAGKLEAIWVKRARRGKMDEANQATLVAGAGIVGNADQGRARQVTIIEREVWDRLMEEINGSAGPSARRANLMVSQVPLANSRGRTLRVGPVRIKIRGETKPCNLMEETVPGLRAAMAVNWGGGAFGEVLDDGDIKVGDDVRFEDE